MSVHSILSPERRIELNPFDVDAWNLLLRESQVQIKTEIFFKNCSGEAHWPGAPLRKTGWTVQQCRQILEGLCWAWGGWASELPWKSFEKQP